MKKYLSFLKSMWFLVALGLVLNLLFGLLKTEGAVYIQKTSDAIESGLTGAVPMLVVIGGGLTFLSFVIRWLGAIVPQYLSERFSYDTRVALFEHLSKIPFLRYEAFTSGELQSRIQNDTNQAGFVLYIVLSRMLSNVFLFIFSIYTMALTDLTATITAVIIVIAATTINQLILKNMKKREKSSQAALAEMTKSLEITFFSVETIKSYSVEDYCESLYKEKQNEYCESKMKVTVIRAIRTLWYSITENLCLYGSICYLGILGINGSLTIGEVLMFIYLVKQIIMPIEMVLRWMANLAGCAAGMERVSELMDIESDHIPAVHPELEEAKTVNVNNINFAYTTDSIVLNNICLEFKKNNISLISGGSGSGKTTLLKIISGLYSAESCTYLIDGKAVSEFSPYDVAYASMDKSIFPMSIYDNVALGDTDISKSDVELIIHNLGFSDWLNSLPCGVDTEIYDNISGGQRQAVTNARTILSGRNIFIFDEAFSALDTEKEKLLVRELEKNIASHFVVLVSHRSIDFSQCVPVIHSQLR